MRLRFWRYDLKLAHRWAISSSVGSGGSGGKEIYEIVFVELGDKQGTVGIGEAAPSSRYNESVDSVVPFMEHINSYQLSFDDIPGSMRCLDLIAPRNFSAKGAINIALLDGAARKAGRRVCDFLGLGFTEGRHMTSFSIGIDQPTIIREKVLEAERYPVLKLKVGSPHDQESLAALREVAPRKLVRVDANEAWKTKEEALRQIERLAADDYIQFVEQPMPAASDLKDLVWLKQRSPLPLMADESYTSAAAIDRCAEAFHAVNVKLAKTGGISEAKIALAAARERGLKTMLGCMIESSVLISAAAHLAELTDYLDLDGNLLVTNDPYQGVRENGGILSFAQAPLQVGLCTQAIPPTC